MARNCLQILEGVRQKFHYTFYNVNFSIEYTYIYIYKFYHRIDSTIKDKAL